MSEPEKTLRIVASFGLEHTDSTDGVYRELGVAIDECNNAHFIFTTKQPGGESFKSLLSLSEISLDMLFHAVDILQDNLDRHLHPKDAQTH